ncbi:MAG: BMC domain-containing protein [Phycisphaera sp.]|nr:BMC domain-containing protein [Phycisphaera sp.]
MITHALGILEINALTPAMVALDAMEKAADIRVRLTELNDLAGVCTQITGDTAAVEAAIAAGVAVAEQMRIEYVVQVGNGGQAGHVGHVIPRPSGDAERFIVAKPEYTPLMESEMVWFPKRHDKENSVADPNNFALGFIETQGYTAVFEAIDTACKAANVEVVGKEKLGGGFITVVIKGDVAAVKAAIESGSAKVEGLGKLIAAHVIARPSESVMALMSNV